MALFQVTELLKIGVEDETTGVSFYTKLAKATKNDDLRKTYASLAEQERFHQARFQKMLDEYDVAQPSETYEGEYIAYLRAMLDSRAFPDPKAAEQAAAKCKEDADAVTLAIRFERDTLILMNELRGMVPKKDVGTVDELAREEQGHLVQLNAALANLAG